MICRKLGDSLHGPLPHDTAAMDNRKAIAVLGPDVGADYIHKPPALVKEVAGTKMPAGQPEVRTRGHHIPTGDQLVADSLRTEIRYGCKVLKDCSLERILVQA